MNIENYYNLAYKLAHKYKNHNIDIEDAKQSALLGLYKAQVKYNQDISCFSTYCYYYILSEIRELNYLKNTISIKSSLLKNIEIENIDINNHEESSEIYSPLTQINNLELASLLLLISKSLHISISKLNKLTYPQLHSLYKHIPKNKLELFNSIYTELK